MKRELEEDCHQSKRAKNNQIHNSQHSSSPGSGLQSGAGAPRPKQLSIQRLDYYDKVFPYFRKPTEIGCFSQDDGRKFRNDASMLKIYCPPKSESGVSFNLRDGYDIFEKKDESVKENLDDLLRWILCHKTKFVVPNQPANSLATDFICWRGLLTKLLCTPYENRDGWLIAASLHNNTCYLCEFDTADRIRQKQNETEKQKEMSYWGFKFEQYVTADPEIGTPRVDVAVNNKEAYGCVVRTRLNKHSIVYAGEVDCYEMVNNEKKYVELKTSREMEHPRQLSNFKRFKVIKWWAQSFLIGIEKVVCGFRDDEGVVRRLADFQTKELPKYCQDIQRCWQPNICFNFLDNFLQHVKDTVKDPQKVYVFSWTPRDSIKCELYPTDSKYSFLPTWYTAETS